ncbi:hypothetical protein T4B_4959 [Trichinella pseudospiralis]|uniref:Uncharacterized protein n=1 Tax=Trichinella pseudospiralis TaxID=6337 RepID=A0A0V1JBC3_TRIPS|nr:hypothetical protein T4B_4959 [Trichinella pseudospiralis]
MCLSERRRLSQAEISVQFLGRQVEDGETDQFAFCLPGFLSNFSHSTSEFSERLVLSRASDVNAPARKHSVLSQQKGGGGGGTLQSHGFRQQQASAGGLACE